MKTSSTHQPLQILHELPQVHPTGPIAIDGLSHPSPDPTLMLIHAVRMTLPVADRAAGLGAYGLAPRSTRSERATTSTVHSFSEATQWRSSV
jgi:hypothetical protein